MVKFRWSHKEKKISRSQPINFSKHQRRYGHGRNKQTKSNGYKKSRKQVSYGRKQKIRCAKERNQKTNEKQKRASTQAFNKRDIADRT